MWDLFSFNAYLPFQSFSLCSFGQSSLFLFVISSIFLVWYTIMLSFEFVVFREFGNLLFLPWYHPSFLVSFLSSVTLLWETLPSVYLLCFHICKHLFKNSKSGMEKFICLFFCSVTLSREKFLLGEIFWFWFCYFMIPFT